MRLSISIDKVKMFIPENQYHTINLGSMIVIIILRSTKKESSEAIHVLNILPAKTICKSSSRLQKEIFTSKLAEHLLDTKKIFEIAKCYRNEPLPPTDDTLKLVNASLFRKLVTELIPTEVDPKYISTEESGSINFMK